MAGRGAYDQKFGSISTRIESHLQAHSINGETLRLECLHSLEQVVGENGVILALVVATVHGVAVLHPGRGRPRAKVQLHGWLDGLDVVENGPHIGWHTSNAEVRESGVTGCIIKAVVYGSDE